jgi:hypothetical protein
MNTLELALRKSKSQTGEYEVELVVPTTNQSPVTGRFVSPYNADKPETQKLLDALGFDQYAGMLGISLKEKRQILKEDIGIALFNALFTGQLFDYYKEIINSSRHLNIQLNITEPFLLNVPWEYMYDDKIVKDFLTISGRFHISLTRLFKPQSQSNFAEIAIPTDFPLQMLVIISKPRSPNFHFEDRIEKEWLSKLSKKRLEIDFIENPASFSKLEERLTEKSYDILHFLGHGELTDEGGVLLFEDNNVIQDRGIDRVTGERLARVLLNQQRLRLVFLNACLTGRNLGKPFSSVATALLKNSCALNVVAMQFKIADEVGSKFAARFYHNLSVGKTIDESISAARRSIYGESERQTNKTLKEIYETQWGVPVYYTQYNKSFRLVKLVKWQKDELIQEAKIEARHLENKALFEQAIEIWEDIRAIDPNEPKIDSEIQHLKYQQQRTNEIANMTNALVSIAAEEFELIAEVQQRLKKSKSTQAEFIRLSELVNELINDVLTLKDFKDKWEESKVGDLPISNTNKLDYSILAENLKYGYIVLFIGSDIPNLFDARVPATEKIVSTLAEKASYDNFEGSLSMIAQYYEFTQGKMVLKHHLQNLLNVPSTIPLYQSLAEMTQSLIIISTAYDTLLEEAFEKAGKKYVLISPAISVTDDNGIQILVPYSDKEAPVLNLEDNLLEEEPLKFGYSLIYKIRGCLDNQETLILSEDNYFLFARYMDDLIPRYIVKEYANRQFLFLGYTPKQWEDRLMVNAILNKRSKNTPSSYIIRQNVELFEIEYWKRYGVSRYDIDFKEFIQKLSGNF